MDTALNYFDRDDKRSIANLIMSFSVDIEGTTIRSPIRRINQTKDGVLSIDFDKTQMDQMNLISAALPEYINQLLLPYGKSRVLIRTSTGSTFGSL